MLIKAVYVKFGWKRFVGKLAVARIRILSAIKLRIVAGRAKSTSE